MTFRTGAANPGTVALSRPWPRGPPRKPKPLSAGSAFPYSSMISWSVFRRVVSLGRMMIGDGEVWLAMISFLGDGMVSVDYIHDGSEDDDDNE